MNFSITNTQNISEIKTSIMFFPIINGPIVMDFFYVSTRKKIPQPRQTSSTNSTEPEFTKTIAFYRPFFEILDLIYIHIRKVKVQSSSQNNRVDLTQNSLHIFKMLLTKYSVSRKK